MAWVGARAFDTVGVNELPGTRRAAAHRQLRPRGEGLRARDSPTDAGGRRRARSRRDRRASGPDAQAARRVQAVRPPADFEGEVVGLQDSAVADASLRALGATPRPVPGGAVLDGLDAYEQQLSSIQENSYDSAAEYVTTNVNLWPRPLVILMGSEVFASLTTEQQSALREAVAAAMPEALAASRAEDEDAAHPLPPRPDFRRRFGERPFPASCRPRARVRRLRTIRRPGLTSRHHRPKDRDRGFGRSTYATPKATSPRPQPRFRKAPTRRR